MKRRILVSFMALLVLSLVTGALSSVSAQTSKGTVTGLVTDQNGAVVPGAEIELKNAATNQVRTTATNDSGLYRLDAVDLAVYDLTIRHKGFKTLTNTGIEIQANRIANIDVKLEVGTTEETVNVNAASGDLLQTSDPVRGGNFSTTQVRDLPSTNLNPYDLGRLLPGVATATGGSQFGNASQFSVNGQRPRGNNYLIDGTENNDISVTGPANQINNEDAVAEVSLQTGLFSAEFGRAGGGVFNLITKSGNNQFHGTMRWLILSQWFNALSTNDHNAGRTKPGVFTENIFGGTIGGPLPLPRFGEGGRALSSGKDRTFFFFGLQYDRFRSTTVFGGSGFRVPTQNGVNQLLAMFPAGTNPRVDLYLTAIGAARGQNTLQTIALGTGSNGLGAVVNRGTVETGLVQISAPSLSNDRQWVLRIDHKINDKHQLAFRYIDDNNINPASAMNSPFFTRDFVGFSRNFLVTHTWVVSPSLTNELRVSPYGLINFNFPISPTDPALAFTLPNIGITNLSAVGIATNIPQFRIAKNYLVQDTMTKTYGTHTFRFGVEFLKQVAQQHPPFNERGSFGFANGGGFTALANFIDNFSGANGNANINIGQPIYHPNLFRQSYFFQDTWKATQDLTLTLGTRYENFGQPANSAFRFPAFAGFDPAQFLVPNKVKPDNNNFGPILGLAYAPRGARGPMRWLFGENKGVIRMGYQVTYDTFFNNLLSNIAADAPNNFSVTTTGAATNRGTANFFPGAIPTVAPTLTTANSTQTSVFNPNVRNPYTQRWSVGLQRELPGRFIVDASYVGSAGRKLFVSEDLNPIVNPSTGARLFPNFGIRRYRSSGANSNYHSMQLRVDKRLSRGFQINTSYTWSHLLDQISEVFATDQTNSSLASVPPAQGPGLKMDYANSDYDRRHRVAINYIWEIPGPREGWLSQIAGGWRVAGITVIQSGAPFTLINGLDRNGDGQTGPDRPDIGNASKPHNTRGVIDTLCASGLRSPELSATAGSGCVTRNDVFAVQVATNTGTSLIMPGLATIGRNTEHAQRTMNFDMSFFKAFRISESVRLEARLDAFNVFNHKQFTAIPAASLNSGAGSFYNFAQTNGGNRNMRAGLKLTF